MPVTRIRAEGHAGSGRLRTGSRAEEYDRIVRLLGRDPTYTELGLFSALWSEHCAYKPSRVFLRRLPDDGRRTCSRARARTPASWTSGAGSASPSRSRATTTRRSSSRSRARRPGWAASCATSSRWARGPSRSSTRCASADPTSRGRGASSAASSPGSAGTATASGARPSAARSPSRRSTRGNPLVNVMCLGLVRDGRDLPGARRRGGQPCLLRRRQDRAATASTARPWPRPPSTRPRRSGGPPCRWAIRSPRSSSSRRASRRCRTGAVVGIQDMGAAGLACCLSEMPARAGTGMEVELDRVPQRETGMTPYEILLSESQERMLLVAERGPRGRGPAGLRQVGAGRRRRSARVTGRRRAPRPHAGRGGGRGAGQGPGRRGAGVRAADGARPTGSTGARASTRWRCPSRRTPAPRCSGSWRRRRSRPRSGRLRQYDQQVGINTLVLPGSDAAVLRIKGTRRAVAVATDGNGRYGLPRSAAWARRWRSPRPRATSSCAGGRPLGADRLPELRLAGAARRSCGSSRRRSTGIAAACRGARASRWSGGNVSFYNETLGPGDPADAGHRRGRAPRRRGARGDPVVQGGRGRRRRSWATRRGEPRRQRVPLDACTGGSAACRLAPLDLERERAVQAACRAAIEAGCVRSAHDCAEGGLAVALAEAASPGRGPLGRDGDAAGRRPRATRRSSARGRRAIVVSVAPGDVRALRRGSCGVGGARAGHRPGGRGSARVRVGVAARLSLASRRSPTRSGTGVASAGAAVERCRTEAEERMNAAWLDDDKFHDECGLFGVWNHPEAANVTYLGLYALQHRGQESAGIAATDGRRFHVEKAMGWVADVFSPERLRRLPGHAPSATSATRPRAARTSGTPSRSARRLARGPIAHRPQRQPGQRRGAPQGAGGARRDLPVHLRHRGHPAPARPRRPADASRDADRRRSPR